MIHSLTGFSHSLGCANQIQSEVAEGCGQGRKREADAAALLGQVEVCTDSVARVLQVEEVHEGTCHNAYLTHQ